MKSHGVYETPGGTILLAAHRELESITLDRDTLHYKDTVAQRYAEMVYYGQWFTPLREALEAFFDKTQDTVTGSVRLSYTKGMSSPWAEKAHSAFTGKILRLSVKMTYTIKVMPKVSLHYLVFP